MAAAKDESPCKRARVMDAKPVKATSSLTDGLANKRGSWLTALTCVAEGSSVVKPVDPATAAGRATPAVVVAAVLDDSRLALIGAIEGKPRSLASVRGGMVALFLDGCFAGQPVAQCEPPGQPRFRCVTPNHAGTGFIASSDAGQVVELDIHGVQTRVICNDGKGKLKVGSPMQVSVAKDGFVFIAEATNGRVQVLTPEYKFHMFVCMKALTGAKHVTPQGVTATEDTIYVSASVWYAVGDTFHSVYVIDRASATWIRRINFGSYVWGLCLLPKSGLLAVAEPQVQRVTLFEPTGAVVRRIRSRCIDWPFYVSSSGADELLVVSRPDAHARPGNVAIFTPSGELHKSCGFEGTLCAAVLRKRQVLCLTENKVVVLK